MIIKFELMINPENNIPIDDSQASESDDQQSQKDLHSNGFDTTNVAPSDEEEASPDMLEQAYDAAEPSFTLDDGEEPSDHSSDEPSDEQNIS
jgi:hypothetical protein